jgi:hypothetical protein
VTLEEEFDEACRKAVAECIALGYVPSAWIAMMDRWGSVEAARRLVVSGEGQTGFERLIRMGRSDLTVEHAVLEQRRSSLFTDEHRAAAQWRLRLGRPS